MTAPRPESWAAADPFDPPLGHLEFVLFPTFCMPVRMKNLDISKFLIKLNILLIGSRGLKETREAEPRG